MFYRVKEVNKAADITNITFEFDYSRDLVLACRDWDGEQFNTAWLMVHGYTRLYQLFVPVKYFGQDNSHIEVEGGFNH